MFLDLKRILSAFFCVCVPHLWTKYRKTKKQTKGINGTYCLFFPLGLFAALFPTCWWNSSLDWSWQLRATAYFSHRDDVVSMTPLVEGPPIFYTCSPEVAKQFLKQDGQVTVKPQQLFRPLLTWGQNLITSNHDVWRRHRRIMTPAFTPKTFALVWKETKAVYEEMIAEECAPTQKLLQISDANHYTRLITLLVIARCGFGWPMKWQKTKPEKMTFGQALEIVVETSIPRLALPRWAYKLPIKRLHDIETAWTKLGVYMEKFVDDKANGLEKLEVDDNRGDLFTRVVAAMNDAEDRNGLSKQEVIGNTYAMAMAGHETTARVFAALLALLAVHQDVQERLYQEVIQAVESSGLDSEVSLPFTLACVYEAVRLYPAGHVLPRQIPDGMSLKVERPEPKVVAIPAGSWFVVDMIGLHYNPNIFKDPKIFNPDRWLGVPELDVSVFGFGPRSCIGRKFAQSEAVCLLAHIVKDWHIDVTLSGGETREKYAERVLGHADLFGLAFGIGKVPIEWRRR